MDRLSHKILDKIKTENVTPKSRWYFIGLNSLLILAIILSIIVGSIAMAVIIRHFALTDWELAHQFTGGHIQSFFIFLPYLWLIFILVAIFSADALFKQTKTGYKWRSWTIALGSIILSANFGYITYLIKIDQPLEDLVLTNIPFYKQWENDQDKLFAAPDMGVLAGRILEVNSEKEWILVDFADHRWLVSVDQAKMKNDFIPKAGLPVGMLGEPLDNNHFDAKMITLWRKRLLPPPPGMEIYP